MISEKLGAAINDQVNKEWWSAGIYKAIEAYYSSNDLPGLANYFNIQALEELSHGEKLFEYMLEVGAKVELKPFPEIKGDYSSALDAAQYALDHEKLVTSLINDLMTLAKEENDHAAQIMLQWFVTEQVEEVASAQQLASDLKVVEGDGRGLLMVDREMGQRSFAAPE